MLKRDGYSVEKIKNYYVAKLKEGKRKKRRKKTKRARKGKER